MNKDRQGSCVMAVGCWTLHTNTRDVDSSVRGWLTSVRPRDRESDCTATQRYQSLEIRALHLVGGIVNETRAHQPTTTMIMLLLPGAIQMTSTTISCNDWMIRPPCMRHHIQNHIQMWVVGYTPQQVGENCWSALWNSIIRVKVSIGARR